MIDYAREGRPLKGVTDQTSIPTFAPDLAGRILDIIDLRAYDLYQVTNTGVAPWYEFAQVALELANLSDGHRVEPVTRASLNQLAPRPHNSALRCLVSENLGLAPLRHLALKRLKISSACLKSKKRKRKKGKATAAHFFTAFVRLPDCCAVATIGPLSVASTRWSSENTGRATISVPRSSW